jgi:hypothetical protein
MLSQGYLPQIFKGEKLSLVVVYTLLGSVCSKFTQTKKNYSKFTYIVYTVCVQDYTWFVLQSGHINPGYYIVS